MADTRSEINHRWERKAYKKYICRLRVDTDADLIEWIDKHKDKYGTTNIFRDAVKLLIENYKED